MYKVYLVCSGLVFLAVQSVAQQSFTDDNSFQVNSSSTLGFAVYLQSYETIVPQTGSNHTWDFQSANWTNPVTPYLFQTASVSPHTVFHHTGINEYSNILFGRNHFYTYSEDRDTLYSDGFYSAANYLYRPRIPYLSFPLNFGDSVYTRTRQFAVPTQPSTATGSITRYWIYDGFGTLQLPYGTVQDVYRIRTRQVDSSYILNSGTVYDEMIWFRADGIPVLRLLKNATIMSAYFSSTGASGVKELYGNTQKIRIYPNPARDRLRILTSENHETATYQILDNWGKIVKRGTLSDPSFEVDIRNLSSGVYFLSVNRTSPQILRFIKI
jgi:hypothetical protein